MEQKSNTHNYAERELNILCKTVDQPLVEPFIPEILALCEKFGRSGQSGGSALPTALSITGTLKKLLMQQPICDITGIDDEWNDVTEMSNEGTLYQNNRCSAVFKNNNGSYYLDAIVWKDEKGSCWSGPAFKDRAFDNMSGPPSKREQITGRQYIKSFPFTPKTFYIDVISKEVAKDDWEFYIKDPKQLQKVFQYYKSVR